MQQEALFSTYFVDKIQFMIIKQYVAYTLLTQNFYKTDIFKFL